MKKGKQAADDGVSPGEDPFDGWDDVSFFIYSLRSAVSALSRTTRPRKRARGVKRCGRIGDPQPRAAVLRL